MLSVHPIVWILPGFFALLFGLCWVLLRIKIRSSKRAHAPEATATARMKER